MTITARMNEIVPKVRAADAAAALRGLRIVRIELIPEDGVLERAGGDQSDEDIRVRAIYGFPCVVDAKFEASAVVVAVPGSETWTEERIAL